jgi:carbonic anhydrase/acetyltransferase-like protein (isoleucine patch superfamily)
MRRSRKQLKELKGAARDGDIEAAKSLLAHSLAFGHARLSLRRFFDLQAQGACGLEVFRESAIDVAGRIAPGEVFRIARKALSGANDRGAAAMLNAAAPRSPFILSYDGVFPHFETEPLSSGPGVSVLGRVRLGARAVLGRLSVIRADGHFVEIGDDLRLGERATVHIAHEVYPARIGNRVYVGRNAVVHACNVADDCVIQDDVVILDGSEVESNVLIEAGSTVYPRSRLLSGHVYAGSPAVSVRPWSEVEAAASRAKIEKDIAASLIASVNVKSAQEIPDTAFVAATASLRGHVDLRNSSSIFFSCELDAGQNAIIVRDNTNVQDNSSIISRKAGVIVGRDTTIGHNVTIEDSRVGDRCLIGIGSIVNAGSNIQDDVLLAAGSTTSPGQCLESGWLYAGRPAKPLSKMNDSKRDMMRSIVEIYCAYGRAFRVQQELGG